MHLSFYMPCPACHSSASSRRLVKRQMHHSHNQTTHVKTWPATSFDVRQPDKPDTVNSYNENCFCTSLWWRVGETRPNNYTSSPHQSWLRKIYTWCLCNPCLGSRMSCKFQAIDSHEERQPGWRSSYIRSFPWDDFLRRCQHFSLRFSLSKVDSMDPSQAALASVLETNASWLPRVKLTSKEAPVEVGDVAWLLEELTPRGIWPQGCVTRIFSAADNIARSCELETALGSLTRPAVKLQKVYLKQP